MAAIHDMTLPLLPDRFYHIYNRGIDRKSIFYNDGNRLYFLQKYAEKTQGYYRTFAYCLMDNHFHLLVQPLPSHEIISQAKIDFDIVNQTFLKDYVLPWLSRLGHDIGLMTISQLEDLTNFKNLLNLYEQLGDIQHNDGPNPPNLSSSSFSDQLCSWILSERLRGFMLGYAKAINKQQHRTGSLFQKGFRRKFIPDDIEQKKQVLFYIYHNPIHHYFTDNYDDYVWSSYNTIKSNLPTKLKRETVIKWFGSVENFISYGIQYQKFKDSFNWLIEED
jgi:putative transposase